MNEDTPDRQRSRADFLRLTIASLLGGLIVVAGSDLRSMVGARIDARDPAPVTSRPGPELSEEWKWRPKAMSYERMIRKTDRPERNDWIRGSGR